MPHAAELLEQYRLFWQSFLTSFNSTTQKQFILAMMELRASAAMPDEDWDDFTATLTGFDDWWLRVREEYVDRLSTLADQMEMEE